MGSFENEMTMQDGVDTDPTFRPIQLHSMRGSLGNAQIAIRNSSLATCRIEFDAIGGTGVMFDRY